MHVRYTRHLDVLMLHLELWSTSGHWLAILILSMDLVVLIILTPVLEQWDRVTTNCSYSSSGPRPSSGVCIYLELWASREGCPMHQTCTCMLGMYSSVLPEDGDPQSTGCTRSLMVHIMIPYTSDAYIRRMDLVMVWITSGVGIPLLQAGGQLRHGVLWSIHAMRRCMG